MLTIKNQNDVTDVVLVFLLLALNIFFTPFSSVSIVDFEQVNASCVILSDTNHSTYELLLQEPEL